MRKAFNFYRSYYEVAKELEGEDRHQFLWAIVEAQFTGEIVEPESKIARLVFKGQAHSIEKQLEGYKHGLKTPIKEPLEAPLKAPLPQVQEQEKEKVQGKVEEEKKKFYTSLIPFTEEYGKEMVREFYEYWTEPNQSNTKLRYQLEKTWSTSRRLKTWAKNSKSFGGAKPKNDTNFEPYG